MAVNVKGVFLCMKYEIEQMLRQGGKGYSIVNTSSISGLVAYRLGAIYGASKHAVVGLTKSAAVEVFFFFFFLFWIDLFLKVCKKWN